MLVAAAREVGGVQIQNRGTLGGNVANASPAGDTLPVLAAADASVVLTSADRHAPRAVFSVLHRLSRDGSAADELIAAFEIPVLRGRQWFRKVGTRAAQAISKVVMAARFEPPRGSGPAVVRVAFGSVAPTVVRATRTEAALAAGASLDVALGVAGRGDRADRRHPVDCRVSPPCRRQPARAVLERGRKSEV